MRLRDRARTGAHPLRDIGAERGPPRSDEQQEKTGAECRPTHRPIIPQPADDGECPALAVRIEQLPEERLPAYVEVAAYYLAAEALTNSVKHARASGAAVRVAVDDGLAVIEISDDGIGGATVERGSALRGFADRVEALGGQLTVDSPRGSGARLRAEVPTLAVG